MKALKYLLIFLATLFPLTGGETYYEIPIEGDIEPALTVFIRRSIKTARDNDAKGLIFSINTFGGRVDAALQIASLIGSVRDIPTIAYIPSQAESLGVSWSAGALISFSCSQIYMAEGTSMGAAAPVYMTTEGTQGAEEKTVSAVRVQMAALAEKNGYPKAIALAMVDKDLEVVEIIEGETIRVVLSDEAELLKKEAEAEGKTLTIGRTVSPAGKLLTMTPGDMLRYGVSSGTVTGNEDLYTRLDIKEVETVTKTLPDKLVFLITGTSVVALLMMAGMVGLYLEITSPGFGVPGTVALIAFAIVFLGGSLLGTLGSLELLLFLLGVILLAVEIFLIPGFGVTGVSGIVAIGIALILSRQDFILPEWEWQWDLFQNNLLLVSGSILASFLLIALLMSMMPRISAFSPLILQTDNVYTVTESEAPLSVGDTGFAETVLRPVGKGLFKGRRAEIETSGAFIEKGEEVVITEIRGNHIYVRKAEA